MKKVLYTASTFGHLASFHRPYIKWFAEQGCEVHAAAGGTLSDFEGVSRYIELPFHKSMFSLRNFAAVWKLARVLRRERYDLISTHTALAAFFTRLAVMFAGKRKTVVMNTSHGYLFDQNTSPLKRALLLGAEQITAGVTDYVLTMNRQDTALARKYKLGRHIIETPGMGVDASRFAPATEEQKAAARAALGLPPDAFVLVYAAEFSKRKNQIMLIEALRALPENVHLLLPGMGELQEVCRARAEKLNIARRVHFPGYLSDIASAYHASDVCVSASRIEGLPFNIMEAMCCGLPVVATDIKGHEDIVIVNKNGSLFPYGNQENYTKIIHGLLGNKDRRISMGMESVQEVRRFLSARVFPILINTYFRALP